MKLYFICLFILLNIVTVNANSTILQNQNFDNVIYNCDFANSSSPSNELTPFANFKVLWPSTRPALFFVKQGIITVSTSNAPFSTTNSLKQYTSTQRGFLGADSAGKLKPTISPMYVTIDETTPLNQKVLMEANYLFKEAQFNKTVFLAKSTKDGTPLSFKTVFSNNGMIQVSLDGKVFNNLIPWEVNRWYHVAVLVDIANSTIIEYVNGEALIETSSFIALPSKTIEQIYLSTITGLPTVIDTDESTVFIDDVKITSADNITYDFANARADIISTTFYALDNSLLTIKQVPKATTVANFKSKVKLAPNTTLNLYDANGILLSDVSEVTDTTTAVVTAPDGVTKKMYSIAVIPNPEFKANGQIIENISNAYGKTLEATVEVTNDGTPYPLRAILALYNNYGKMIKSIMSAQTQAPTGTSTFTANINVPNPIAGETYKAKFMLWNLLKPVREVVELK